MTSLEWLDSPSSEGEPIVNQLARLSVMNPGLEVFRWGKVVWDGPLGRTGLNQQEALRLIWLSGVMGGFKLAEDWDGHPERERAFTGRLQETAQQLILAYSARGSC